MEIEKHVRYRVNVSTSTKGQKTYDCTVETTGFTMDEALQKSDELVRQLDQRYPAPIS